MKAMPGALSITVAIPTYRREQVLLDTIAYLLDLEHAPAEILVLDQTEQHEVATENHLGELHDAGRIRWLRLATPSIPQAMNRGLLEARQDIVLFLDDDVCPEPELIAAHLAAQAQFADVLAVGRVIQPWEEGLDFLSGGHSIFADMNAGWLTEFIGCNFSVRRDQALALGGFDENFVRVAYRFEAEFAHRWCASGRRIYFEPIACLHHLKDCGGGTRTFGEHLTTMKPDHAVGAYYFCLRTGSIGEFLHRPFRSVATRHHLRRPWWIPLSLIAELRGMLWALALYTRGPRYVAPKPEITSARSSAATRHA